MFVDNEKSGIHMVTVFTNIADLKEMYAHNKKLN